MKPVNFYRSSEQLLITCGANGQCHGLVLALASYHYSLDEVFEDSKAYIWMLKNAATYGFQLSYPESQSKMMFEPWHWQFQTGDQK